ncbi:MAG: T9SS type A sorting domain-containing protein [Bacteroidetes bacterium]|nr:T9SS type A sorting domain-containing protein [Bacteroidota bacterium]
MTLNATSFSPEAVSYQWYLNGNILNGQTSPTLSIPSLNNTNTGAYVCTYSNLCSSIPTDTAMVQLLTAGDVTITPNPAVTCPGVPLTVTAISPVSASSYSWTVVNGLVISTASAITPTLSSGAVSYTVSVASGTCMVQTAVTVSVTSCTGIEENLLSETSVFPNPVKDMVTIRLSELKSGLKADIQSVEGRVLKTVLLDSTESKISLAEFAEGIYFIRVHSGNDQSTYKIIKQ